MLTLISSAISSVIQTVVTAFFSGFWKRLFPAKTADGQRADDLAAENKSLVAEAKAGAEAPTDKTAMERLLQEGKFIFALFLLGLSSCTSSGVAYPCLYVKDWSDVQQMNMKADIQALPNDSTLIPAMLDYERMRAQARACSGG
jgi:hypothetical protein